MLMLDRNGNGRLDDGSELFGDMTVLPDGMRVGNGFQALTYYDADGDSKIDANDPIWSQLKIWQHDALGKMGYFVDPDTSYAQISSLDELGITAIYLDSQIANQTDNAGNTAVRIGQFQWADGTTSTIADYRVQRDTGQTIAVQELEIPSEIAALPDLHGQGNVYDLRQAMAHDSSGQLKALVEIVRIRSRSW